jgi:hypothetical protein
MSEIYAIHVHMQGTYATYIENYLAWPAEMLTPCRGPNPILQRHARLPVAPRPMQEAYLEGCFNIRDGVRRDGLGKLAQACNHNSVSLYVVCGSTGGRVMSMKAFRGGVSTPYWSNDPSGVSLRNYRSHPFWRTLIRFGFSMPSKGGGTTCVRLDITPDSFGEIMKAMVAADEGATLRAMGEALRDSKDVTIKACGDILLDQRKADSAAAVSPTTAPATVVSWVKAVA